MSGDVLLDLNWRRWDEAEQTDIVGWPLPAKASDPWASERVAEGCAEYAEAGFAGLRFWPSCECGGGRLSDGYDKKDDYSLNNTAFGNEDDLLAAVASAKGHRLKCYGDLVLHQYGGYGHGNYTTKQFPKTPTCFAKSETIPGGVSPDPVPDPNGNWPFGDLASYLNSLPDGYMYYGAIAAAEWLTRTVGFDGYRIDDCKGTYAGVVIGILDALKLPAIAEYFDGNPVMVSRYVNRIMKRKISVLDFAQKFNMGDICNNNSKVWMGRLADIGWCTKDWATAATFIDSADTDNSPGQQTIWNKILGYAMMLTFPGQPSVYYRDWSTDENCYGLKKPINNLIWIRNNLAHGEFVPRLDTHPQVFVHERMGLGTAPGAICAFNNDRYNEYTVRVPQRHEPGTRLHEYTGLAGYNSDRWVDSGGGLTMTVPKNDNGRSYLVYAPWVG